MSKETEIVKIENAIGRELTDAEFFRFLDRMCAVAQMSDIDAAVESFIRELKAA